MKKLLLVILLLAGMSWAQTAVVPMTNPHVQLLDASGNPCAGCLLDTFSAGTTNALATFSESTGTSLNSNPVVADANGYVTVYFQLASYKLRLRSAAGVTIWTQDGINPVTSASTFTSLTSTGNVVIKPSTAATGGANQSSPTLCIDGFYFNVTSLIDQWCLQDILGTGASPTSTFSFTHTGSGGTVALSFPNLPVTFANITGAQISATQITNTGDTILSTGKVIKWNSDTGLSRDGAGVIDLGNGTQGDKSGNLKLNTVTLTKTDGTLPAIIQNDTLGGFTFSTSSALGISLSAAGILNIPSTVTLNLSGATSGSTGLKASGIASGTLTLPAATGTLTCNTCTQTLTASTLSGTTPYNRLRANQGTAIVIGDVSALSNLGNTASVSAVSGTDSAGTITIASAGTGQLANGTFTLTFHDGTWTTAPICVVGRGDGSGPGSATVGGGPSATGLAFSFNGVAVAGVSYIFTFICVGK